jgi:glutathione S-transferase
VTAGREEKLPAFRATLAPLRQALKGRAFLGGDAPDYADCIVFGSFMWARSTSPLRLIAPDDAIHAWRERMLDLHGGMARAAPCFGG